MMRVVGVKVSLRLVGPLVLAGLHVQDVQFVGGRSNIDTAVAQLVDTTRRYPLVGAGAHDHTWEASLYPTDSYLAQAVSPAMPPPLPNSSAAGPPSPTRGLCGSVRRLCDGILRSCRPQLAAVSGCRGAANRDRRPVGDGLTLPLPVPTGARRTEQRATPSTSESNIASRFSPPTRKKKPRLRRPAPFPVTELPDVAQGRVLEFSGLQQRFQSQSRPASPVQRMRTALGTLFGTSTARSASSARTARRPAATTIANAATSPSTGPEPEEPSILRQRTRRNDVETPIVVAGSTTGAEDSTTAPTSTPARSSRTLDGVRRAWRKKRGLSASSRPEQTGAEENDISAEQQGTISPSVSFSSQASTRMGGSSDSVAASSSYNTPASSTSSSSSSGSVLQLRRAASGSSPVAVLDFLPEDEEGSASPHAFRQRSTEQGLAPREDEVAEDEVAHLQSQQQVQQQQEEGGSRTGTVPWNYLATARRFEWRLHKGQVVRAPTRAIWVRYPGTWTGEWQVISGDRYDLARIEAVYFALAGGGAYAPWAPMPFDLGLLPEGPMGFLGGGGGGGAPTMLSRALRAATDPTRQPSNVETAALHAHARALRQHRLRHAPPAPGGLERRVQQHYQGFGEYVHHMQVQAFARTHPRVYAGREEFVFDSVARPRTGGDAPAGPDILHRVGGPREQDPERDPDPFYTDPTDWDPTGAAGDNNWGAFAFAGQVYPREVQRGRLRAMAASESETGAAPMGAAQPEQAAVPLPLRKAFSQDSSRVDHERIARIPRVAAPRGPQEAFFTLPRDLRDADTNSIPQPADGDLGEVVEASSRHRSRDEERRIIWEQDEAHHDENQPPAIAGTISTSDVVILQEYCRVRLYPDCVGFQFDASDATTRLYQAESPAVVRFLSRKELPLDLVSSVEAGVPAEEKNSFVYEIVEIP